MGLRSTVYALPPNVRAEIERRLVENGFSDYVSLADELKKRGHKVSKSALHRFGQALEKRVLLARAQLLSADPV
jgi:hypothetical protein